jgi:putative transposase
MPKRKDLLVEGEVYHIFNKSIAGFKIFNTDSEFERMLLTLWYYQQSKPVTKFSYFIKFHNDQQIKEDDKLVDIIAFCLMPTHIHLILKQLKENGISIFMANVLNSYSKYFNTKYTRKGPLYEGRFKNVLVKNTEQLYHLTRYIHLNPVTAHLVKRPEDWNASSYREYISKIDESENICRYDGLFDIDPHTYEKFVTSRIDYQKELAKIKDLIIE